MKKKLEEGEGKGGTGGVAGKNNVGGGNRGVEGVRRWIEEREVGQKGIEESGGEGVLRGKAIPNGEAAAPREACEPGHREAVSSWITEVIGTAMKVEDRHIAGDFGHESLVVLDFGEIQARAVGINVGAVTGPFRLQGANGGDCEFPLASVL